MRPIKMLVVVAAAALTFSASGVLAQQSQHQHDADKQPPAASTKPGMPTSGMDGHMAQHMEMCRQMMGQGSMMGAGMMGMMPMAMMSSDPKQQAEMMAMRGEMMKAMGDIMLKYAQRAQSGK